PVASAASKVAKTCGACTACCDAVAVMSLGKGNWKRCFYQGDSCCTIYPQRPIDCRAFECHWLSDTIQGDERLRPDNLGLIFTTARKEGTEYLTAVEVWDDATSQSPARDLIESLLSKFAVVVLRRRTRDAILCIYDTRVPIPLPVMD